MPKDDAMAAARYAVVVLHKPHWVREIGPDEWQIHPQPCGYFQSTEIRFDPQPCDFRKTLGVAK